MAASNYDECLRHVLGHEGGYVNHPRDPGGETNCGITVAVARANGYRGPMRDIPMDAVKRIYRTKYWDALRCGDLPAGVDYAVFDYGVNSGVSRSAKALQRIVGVADDGRIGPATLGAVRGRDAAALVAAICDARLSFLKRLSTWETFGRGWSRRVASVRKDAAAMAKAAPPSSGVGPAPKPQPGGFLAALLSIFTRKG
jgi:lysozyme family protein